MLGRLGRRGVKEATSPGVGIGVGSRSSVNVVGAVD